MRWRERMFQRHKGTNIALCSLVTNMANGCTTNEDEKIFNSWEFDLDEPVTTLKDTAYWETASTYQQSMGFYLEARTEDGN